MRLRTHIPGIRRLSAPAATFALALGILIWMKLRLVTGLPRSVYAEPQPAPTPPKPVVVDTADKSWRQPPVEETAPAPDASR